MQLYIRLGIGVLFAVLFVLSIVRADVLSAVLYGAAGAAFLWVPLRRSAKDDRHTD